MGAGSWSPDDYVRSTASIKSAPISGSTGVFKATSKAEMKSYLDPKGITVRESRDSVDHPDSTALIVGCDVTGSMGIYARAVAVESLGTLIKETYDRKPISDPQIMFMGIGDASDSAHDQAPLQVSQFESDIRILEQLRDLWIEGKGGGNSSESYTLPWYFAATKTSIDCFEKRGKKGYLFTSGDEECPAILKASEIEKVLGFRPQSDFSARELLHMASKMYHVFHVVIKQGSHYQYHPDRVEASWKDVLGQRALFLDDYTKFAEVVVSTMQIIEGEDKDKVVKSWSGDTSLVVANAVKDLSSITKDVVKGSVRL